MFIHIPSDAPGFLRDQSLVTSGLVPRSVSREPIRCTALWALFNALMFLRGSHRYPHSLVFVK
ncbi:MAG: hypothetical protein LBF66_00910 [Holosporales bacterium]|nr:hypothetical protein [Holosporales bacterium]